MRLIHISTGLFPTAAQVNHALKDAFGFGHDETVFINSFSKNPNALSLRWTENAMTAQDIADLQTATAIAGEVPEYAGITKLIPLIWIEADHKNTVVLRPVGRKSLFWDYNAISGPAASIFMTMGEDCRARRYYHSK